ncbi:MAG: 50S ribosomal protein L22 [Patescibacteria group bacterium]
MNEAKAQLKSYRQSPRKVRLVADAVRGKSVGDAIDILTFMPKRAGLPLKKLIASAYANSGRADNMFVKEIRVDAGSTLYRRRPRSKGMANPIRKRTSHVLVILSEAKKPKAKS